MSVGVNEASILHETWATPNITNEADLLDGLLSLLDGGLVATSIQWMPTSGPRTIAAYKRHVHVGHNQVVAVEELQELGAYPIAGDDRHRLGDADVQAKLSLLASPCEPNSHD